MTVTQPERHPGDAFLDRHIPCATEEERNHARENLHRLAKVILRIEERLAREWHQEQIRKSGDGAVESGRPAPKLS